MRNTLKSQIATLTHILWINLENIVASLQHKRMCVALIVALLILKIAKMVVL